jgi:FtsP/CotA-like multicopper oxidase with cupredoxin domain
MWAEMMFLSTAFSATGDMAASVSFAPKAAVPGINGKAGGISYPGEVTRIDAAFDSSRPYAWRCHIVAHEDNEMMVPYCVGGTATAPGRNLVR